MTRPASLDPLIAARTFGLGGKRPQRLALQPRPQILKADLLDGERLFLGGDDAAEMTEQLVDHVERLKLRAVAVKEDGIVRQYAAERWRPCAPDAGTGAVGDEAADPPACAACRAADPFKSPPAWSPHADTANPRTRTHNEVRVIAFRSREARGSTARCPEGRTCARPIADIRVAHLALKCGVPLRPRTR